MMIPIEECRRIAQITVTRDVSFKELANQPVTAAIDVNDLAQKLREKVGYDIRLEDMEISTEDARSLLRGIVSRATLRWWPITDEVMLYAHPELYPPGFWSDNVHRAWIFRTYTLPGAPGAELVVSSEAESESWTLRAVGWSLLSNCWLYANPLRIPNREEDQA